jgi:hypothetical protein
MQFSARYHDLGDEYSAGWRQDNNRYTLSRGKMVAMLLRAILALILFLLEMLSSSHVGRAPYWNESNAPPRMVMHGYQL